MSACARTHSPQLRLFKSREPRHASRTTVQRHAAVVAIGQRGCLPLSAVAGCCVHGQLGRAYPVGHWRYIALSCRLAHEAARHQTSKIRAPWRAVARRSRRVLQMDRAVQSTKRNKRKMEGLQTTHKPSSLGIRKIQQGGQDGRDKQHAGQAARAATVRPPTAVVGSLTPVRGCTAKRECWPAQHAFSATHRYLNIQAGILGPAPRTAAREEGVRDARCACIVVPLAAATVLAPHGNRYWDR